MSKILRTKLAFFNRNLSITLRVTFQYLTIKGKQ